MQLPALSSHTADHAEWVLDLQRQSGNAAVCSLLQEASGRARAQRQAVAAAPAGETDVGVNPLVGLKRGDGLNVGTFDRRPRVKLLQHRLNEKAGAGLKVDGMWGKATSTALEQFHLTRNMVPVDAVDQATADALTDTTPTPPVPSNAPFNPHVESRLEAVLAEYRFIFDEQKEALHRLERDLADIEDFEPGLVKDLMFEAVKAVVGQFIKVSLDTVVQQVAPLLELDEDQKEQAGPGVFSKIEEPANTTMDELLKETSPGIDDVASFIETQLAGSTSAAAELHSNFLIKTKPAMSKLHPGDAPTSDETDPRVGRAEALRKKVRSSRLDAFTRQYDESLSRWTVYLAQKAVGGKVTTGGPLDPTGTDMSDASKTEAAGVLQITFTTTEPAKRPVVDKVEIAGLSEKIRKRLNQSDRSLGGLGFPVRAEGEGKGTPFFSIFINDPDFLISRNEAFQTFLNGEGTDDNGMTWLRARAAHENGSVPVDGRIKETPEAGASLLMDDLLRNLTGKHNLERA